MLVCYMAQLLSSFHFTDGTFHTAVSNLLLQFSPILLGSLKCFLIMQCRWVYIDQCKLVLRKSTVQRYQNCKGVGGANLSEFFT